MKKAALITVHGMGATPPDYNTELLREMQRRLGARFAALHTGSVYYQGILQPQQQRIWDRMSHQVRWDDLRKFLLYGFSDAAGLESGKEGRASVYTLAQVAVARELYLAWQAVGSDGPVVLLAQSLGGQVISNYFWDAGRARDGHQVSVGIWRKIEEFQPAIAGKDPFTPEALRFLQGESFRHFITTGCNIPIFVAAHARQDIRAIRPNDRFTWANYYDKDDVLGWPLAELSDEYAQVVRDHPVNAGGGVAGWITQSWNPLSHNQYWRDDEVLDPLGELLSQLL